MRRTGCYRGREGKGRKFILTEGRTKDGEKRSNEKQRERETGRIPQ